MIGSGASRPPFPVTLDNWQSAGQLNWTFQHMAEIFPTVAISRGTRPAPSLPRIAYEPDALAVRNPEGETVSVHSVMAGTDTDGWLVVRDHPSWGAQLMVERYPSGMEPSTLHLLMSVTKSVVGTTIGALVGQEVIDTETLVTHYVPALAESGYAGATVRNLLDMRSGIHFSEDYLNPMAEVRVLEQAFGWAPKLLPDVP
ncbi:MAG TPA: serine hydrolase, partial [Microlunatus sp.]